VGFCVGGCCDFGCRGFDTSDCFLLSLSRSPLSVCCGFELRFFRPGLLPGGGHCELHMSVAGLCVVYISGWVWSGEVAEPIGSVVPVRGG